jgi:cytochrome P450
VLSRPELRVRPLHEPIPRPLLGSPAGELFGRLMRMNDGAGHLPLRAAFAPVLAQTKIEHAARACAGAMAEDLRLQNDARSIDRWIARVPVASVAALLGFPPNERAALVDHVERFVQALSPLATSEQHAAAGPAALALLERARELAADPPPHGFAARLVGAAGDLDRTVVAANLIGLLTQTFEATAGLLGNALLSLARRPDLDATLRENRLSLRQHVTEVARADPSIHNTRRFAAANCSIAATSLRTGDAVLVLLAAANCAAPSADAALGHGFGHGRHGCPGADLACDIAAHALGVVLDAGFDFASLPTAVAYRPSVNARIPVFFPPAPRSAL